MNKKCKNNLNFFLYDEDVKLDYILKKWDKLYLAS